MESVLKGTDDSITVNDVFNSKWIVVPDSDRQ